MSIFRRSDHDPIRALHELRREASRGRGAVAIVCGPTACGKSTFLHTFCDQAAEQGALVLDATASPEEEPLRFGVVRQLLRHAPAPLRTLAGSAVALGAQPDHAPAASPDCDPDLVATGHFLSMRLLALAEEHTIVVAVDDAHYLDRASLCVLLTAARGVRAARMLVVAASCTCPDHRRGHAVASLARLPGIRHLRLDCLGPGDVDAALRVRLGTSAAPPLSAACHQATGGNPLLVDAFIEDVLDAGFDAAGAGDGWQAGLPGRRFREAVLDLAHRCPPESLAVLRAAALMGEMATPLRIGFVADMEPCAVDTGLRALESSGLLVDGRCRHAAAAAAVTDDTPVAERQAQHRRFAQLLNEENAPATVIAGQLIEAGSPAPPWATDVLRAAAEERCRDEPETAARYLRAAWRLARDEGERAALTAALAAQAWAASPGAVRRYLPELLDLLRAGRLARPDAELTIRWLLWFGRVGDAAEALEQLLADAEPDESRGAVDLWRFVLWLSLWYPAVVQRVSAAVKLRFDRGLRSEAAGAGPVEAGTVFDLLLGGRERQETAPQAERLLESLRLSSYTVDPLLTALAGLVSADQVDSAERWSDALLRQARGPGARTWRAQLTVVRAELAFRRGEIKVAAGRVAGALNEVGLADWGVCAGLPLATLIRVAVVLGDHDRAAELLDQPVPPEMLETGYGMLYLQARGLLLTATGALERARVEFQACWDFMRQHGVDLPNILPWRLHLAEVMFRLGEPEQAWQLAEEQLAASAAYGAHWANGIALRLLARIAPPPRALELLRHSAKELHAAGARLELAWTLAAMAGRYRAVGDNAKATHLDHRSRMITAACGVTSRTDGALALPDRGEQPGREAGRGSVPGLSEAEQRVAALAVTGLTNVQIARRLFLTVSTIEQHLTHIYRKLKIRGRTELASLLDVSA